MAILHLNTNHIKSSYRHLKAGDIVPHLHLLTPAYRRFFGADTVQLQHKGEDVCVKIGGIVRQPDTRIVRSSEALGADFGTSTPGEGDPYVAVAESSKIDPNLVSGVVSEMLKIDLETLIKNQDAANSSTLGTAPANNALLGG
jgi:hypothetical protein